MEHTVFGDCIRSDHSPTTNGCENNDAIAFRQGLSCKRCSDIECLFYCCSTRSTCTPTKAIKNLVVTGQCTRMTLCSTRAKVGGTTLHHNERFVLQSTRKRSLKCFTVVDTFDIRQRHTCFRILGEPLQIIAYRCLGCVTR